MEGESYMDKIKREFMNFMAEVQRQDIERKNAMDECAHRQGEEVSLPESVEEAICGLDVDANKLWKARMITARLIDNLLYSAGMFHQMHVDDAACEFAIYVDEDSDKYEVVFNAIIAEMPKLRQKRDGEIERQSNE